MANKLSIPRIGTILVLAQDWTFRLYCEHRNKKMFEKIGVPHYYENIADFQVKDIPGVEFCVESGMTEEELDRASSSYRATNARNKKLLKVTLPKNTTLVVNRIYIRQGASAFDSVTFSIPKNKKLPPELARFGGARFWAKLNDVNEIICDIVV